MSQVDALRALLTEIAVPLMALDHATLHVVAASPARVHLHLGGAYAGCPGNGFVERSLLAPLVREVLPSAALEVTSGLPVPAGAEPLGPSSSTGVREDLEPRDADAGARR